MSFWEIAIFSLPKLLNGLVTTLYMTLFAAITGFIMGIILCVGRIYGRKIIRFICAGFIELIRGTPMLVQLFILYYGLPVYGIRLTPLMAALIGFCINSSAYQAEYIRGAIQSIGSGQMVAALSIGMTKWQAVRLIILPQALRRVIPAWTNEFIYLLKYTSMAYIIGAPEMMAQAKFIASRNFEFFKVYLLTAFIYIALVWLATVLFSKLEKRLQIPGTVVGER
ncbi:MULTISPECIES: amino acid ABC transporter permease [Pseudothermotoga]|jgi:polar amino acid transport system permease protein|uniref:Polar amino acid ABC transporter, inner membrane subunit n=1 Tax=Pseudothermotoga lettingae (strain ATCC BAA-301 / DSM 14385 / NBRC 107922 / TMO) TaxID=416591 RepID=A8F5J5_PSELT|nr:MULTISPECIES: amino acid ABC transporter permease [Pseudothermotoga]ABV33429.1 polar amino acid ABC transporter, inner membrane subunit [Pseudothermotoga lettingae TMO]KUK21116.1 MAG: Polar amino acid ABC transporter, inner membrane subunit [Pseudothermotoga lettingae]MDI3495858.1 polar amino acid transport system permease protein [Pseudothermotoga sp.]MDK2883922.1 polar amino acid transport system permease protein [Pseudothermotoga sp.]GLI49657.1 amino acid ABC transporter permease [Pseudo